MTVLVGSPSGGDLAADGALSVPVGGSDEVVSIRPLRTGGDATHANTPGGGGTVGGSKGGGGSGGSGGGGGGGGSDGGDGAATDVTGVTVFSGALAAILARSFAESEAASGSSPGGTLASSTIVDVWSLPSTPPSLAESGGTQPAALFEVAMPFIS